MTRGDMRPAQTSGAVAPRTVWAICRRDVSAGRATGERSQTSVRGAFHEVANALLQTVLP